MTAVGVLVDEVVVDGDGGGGAFAGGGDDLGAGVDGVAGGPDAGDAGASGVVDRTQPFSPVAQPRCVEQVVVRDERPAGRTRRCRSTTSPVVELDAGQLVVVDDQPGNRSSTTPMALAMSCSRWSALRRCRWRSRRRRWTTGGSGGRGCDGFGCAAEDAEGLVADLVAVAVGTVQQVATPPLRDAGDVGDVVAQAGGDQDPAGRRTWPSSSRTTSNTAARRGSVGAWTG